MVLAASATCDHKHSTEKPCASQNLARRTTVGTTVPSGAGGGDEDGVTGGVTMGVGAGEAIGVTKSAPESERASGAGLGVRESGRSGRSLGPVSGRTQLGSLGPFSRSQNTIFTSEPPMSSATGLHGTSADSTGDAVPAGASSAAMVGGVRVRRCWASPRSLLCALCTASSAVATASASAGAGRSLTPRDVFFCPADASTRRRERRCAGNAGMSELLAGVVEEEDLAYEEEVTRNPYSVRAWLRYIDFKATSNLDAQRRAFAIDLLYERALRVLPGSYKLWHAYLLRRTARVRAARPLCAAVRAVCALYERALLTMHKMPVIWLAYLRFLTSPACGGAITRTRHAFDRALQALPISQHDLVWPLYVQFAQSGVPPRTARSIWRRYLMFEPGALEEYCDVLVAQGAYAEAARCLTQLLDRLTGSSAKRTKAGQSHAQVWLKLAELLCKHPREVAAGGTALDTEAIVRAGIARQEDALAHSAPDEASRPAFAPPPQTQEAPTSNNDRQQQSTVGDLWVLLAEYQIRLGNLEKARDVFEEALGSAKRVADFAVVWDAYTQFEDQVIAQSIALLEHEQDGRAKEDEERVLDMQLARYEYLIQRNPLLVSSVFLRQDPHNVHQWFRRVRVLEQQAAADGTGDYSAVAAAYTTALKTVDPKRATGSPHLLWAAFARFYDEAGQHDAARTIYEKGVQQPFLHVDDVASLWCDYIEAELRHGDTQRARDLARRATAQPSDPALRRRGTNAQRWGYTSAKLWALRCDLEECYGTLDSAVAAYEQALAIKSATPQLVLNYAALLEEHRRYEDSYRAFEQGIAAFEFPQARLLWVAFLTRFVQRHRGHKLERARDLFEQALAHAPPADAKTLYVMYASLEEEYGLARHAMAVYDRAVRGVAAQDKYALYLLYIARAGEFFGVMKTRDIYEHALQDTELPLEHQRALALRFAMLERRLGEYDRARAIYAHSAQFCNPDTDTRLWDVWRDFEVQHGNDDTFRDMLRVRRSVKATYMSQIDVQGILAAAADSVAPQHNSQQQEEEEGEEAAADAAPRRKRQGTAMEQLEEEALQQEQQQQESEGAAATTNPEALELDI